jgi:hypothetical protein
MFNLPDMKNESESPYASPFLHPYDTQDSFTPLLSPQDSFTPLMSPHQLQMHQMSLQHDTFSLDQMPQQANGQFDQLSGVSGMRPPQWNQQQQKQDYSPTTYTFHPQTPAITPLFMPQPVTPAQLMQQSQDSSKNELPESNYHAIDTAAYE